MSISQMWAWDPHDPTHPVHDIRFRNNIFRNLGVASGYIVPNLKFYNNVFDNVGGGSLYAIGVCDPTEDSGCTETEIKNNFALNHGTGDGTTAGILYDKRRTGTDYNYNYFAQGPSAGWATISNVAEPNAVNGGNPLFVDYTGGNFHLMASSPAIDCGTIIASFSTDKDGVSRPQSAAWDIGAHEFVPGGDTTPPAAPTGLAVN